MDEDGRAKEGTPKMGFESREEAEVEEDGCGKWEDEKERESRRESSS